MVVPTFTSTGSKATVSVTLPKDIFGLVVTNHELVKAAYVGYLANGRTNNAVTKSAVKFVVAVRSHGAKKAQGVLVSDQAETQSGVVVESLLVQLVMKTIQWD